MLRQILQPELRHLRGVLSKYGDVHHCSQKIGLGHMFANMDSSFGTVGCAKARLAGSMRALSKLLQQEWLPTVEAISARVVHWLLLRPTFGRQPTGTLK